VIPRTRYFYRVAAYNDRGVSGYSNVASATTPAERPRNPTELTARLTSAGEIQLVWRDNDANEDGYRIERVVNGETWTEFANLGPDVQGYTDRSVTVGLTYVYRVRAFNVVGSSLYSNIASVATGEATPASPSGLTGTYSDGLVTLGWTDNSSNESGFRIERSTDGISYEELVTVGPDTLRYWDRSVAAGATYYYRVRAFSPVGASSFTAPLRIAIPVPQPNAPANLRLALVADNSLTLVWNDASGDETGFRIERSTGAAGFVVVGTVAANERSYTDRTVAPLTTYVYVVRAFNGGGDSLQSNVLTVTTPLPEPSVPAGVMAVNNRKKTARVSWTASDGSPVTRYEVLREKYIKRSWRNPATVATLQPGAALSLLDPSGTGTFRYSVRACNDTGCSAYSAPATVKVTK
jgi:titin